MMRVVVLGSGAALPSKQRGLPSVGIRYNGRVYLMDCGEGTQRQMMKYGISYAKVDSIFVTHSHADHILGIAGLAQTLDMISRKEPLRIYCPRGARHEIEALLSIGDYCYEISVSEVGEGHVVDGKDFAVSAFAMRHSRPTLGFVFCEAGRRNFDKGKCDRLGIKGRMFGELEKNGEIRVGKKRITYECVSSGKKGGKVVYTGDGLPSDETISAAKGADLLFHEATYTSEKADDARDHMHSTAAQAAEVAKKAGVGKLILTHISGRYRKPDAHLAEARKIFKKTFVAEDGMELIV